MSERSMVAKCTSVSCSLLDIPVGWLRVLLTTSLWHIQSTLLGIIFWYEGFDFIIPRFGGSSSIGLYGTYHFNDRLSVFTSAGIRKIPNQRFGGTVKIAPQIKIGKRQKIAFRVGSEFYYAKRDQEFYSGYFGNNKYPKTSFFVQGEGPSTTIGWVHEASLSFTIGD